MILESNLKKYDYNYTFSEKLFKTKHEYLQIYDVTGEDANNFESNLSKKTILKSLEKAPRYGRAFLSPQIQIKWESDDRYFYSMGNHLWLTGASEIITRKDKKYLDPESKYFIEISDEDLIIKS
ncbi:hypothetical protein [Natranaerobius trueperi]|uniref:hypothetical protein n=1 Tax=Natranaerobius trueperi TaxID=759412 RepID=UPI000B5AE08C|nr:hypothetical protein [Natranaerobius trueperi]